MEGIEDIYELSPMQQGLLFHSLYQPESKVYFEQLCCTFEGRMNSLIFKKTWQQVVARHPALRTAFYWEGLDKPVQVVFSTVEIPWQDYDWRNLTPTQQQEQLKIFIAEDQQHSFELNQAPLMRFALIRTANESYQLIWSHHHLLIDGWCLPILFKEVIALYQAYTQGQALYLDSPRPFRDYILWLQQQDLHQAETFWRQSLKGLIAPTPIGLEKINPHEDETQDTYQEKSLQFCSTTTENLQDLVRQNRLTLNTLIQGAWAILLSHYSQEDEVVFGATVSGRPPELKGVESMIGLFINTLPVRVKIPEDTPVIPWLKTLQEEQIDREQYAYSPLVEIQGWSEIPRGQSLFESILVLENYPWDTSLFQAGESFRIKQIQVIERTNYPLTVIVMPGSRLLVKISYDSQRFSPSTIEGILGHLQTVLEAIVKNPQRPIKALPILTESEKQQILFRQQNRLQSYPVTQCIHQLFEEQAQRNPHAIAVTLLNQKLTYQELNQKANQVAHYLQNLGIKRGNLVGICVERSLEMIVAILGILKAGAAYVPLDLAYPKTRLELILKDAQVPLLLTQHHLQNNLPEYQGEILYLDRDHAEISQQSHKNLSENLDPSDLAYVIYTSGSTGIPKGVLITHQNVVRLFKATEEWFNFSQEDSWTLFHSYAFDFSVWEIWGALLYGGKLVIVPYLISRSPEEFYQLILQEKITILNQTPSSFRQLINVEESVAPLSELSLRLVIFGGEALELQSLQPWFERHGDQQPQLVNMYGITETTVHVTYRPLTLADLEQKSSLVGEPIPDLQVYILNSQRQLVPRQVAGEMYIAGAGLAQGYLNRPELTAQRFIPNPFSDDPNSRLYRTGDLARYLENGDLEYLGRIDHQVKIRGFRIELGEIESVLNTHPEVTESVVIVREDQLNYPRLVAYIVSNFIPERFPYQQNCWVEVEGKRLNLQTEDISHKGLSLTGENLSKGQKLKIEIILPGEKNPSWLTGTVVWSKGKQSGIELNLVGHDAMKIGKDIKYLWEHSTLLKIWQRTITGHLQKYLKEKLPSYMIPNAFVLLDSIPLTPNGKVNRQALPAPSEFRPELQTTFVKPQTEIETLIAQVWREVLHLDQVGINDNFFDLGGHSLLMIQVQNKLQELLETSLSMVELFQYPTINTLAKRLSPTSQNLDSPLAQDTQPITRNVRANYQQHQRQLRKKHRST